MPSDAIIVRHENIHLSAIEAGHLARLEMEKTYEVSYPRCIRRA